MTLIHLIVERMLRLLKTNGVLLAKRNELLLAKGMLLLLLVAIRDAGRELAERRVLLVIRIETRRKLARRKCSLKLLTSFFFHSFEPIKKCRKISTYM